MNPEEADEQLPVTEYDIKGNIIPGATAPGTEKKKRITVAELAKSVLELNELLDVNVFDWLDKLDTRVRHFENAEAEKPIIETPMLEPRIRELEKGFIIDVPAVWKELDIRLIALETAIGALADAFRQHLEEVSREQPAAAQEIEFAKPPVAIHDMPPQTADITAVASVCLFMNDVLVICRALRNAEDMPDLERITILNIACKAAGVEYTHGLEIRAGIKQGAA